MRSSVVRAAVAVTALALIFVVYYAYTIERAPAASRSGVSKRRPSPPLPVNSWRSVEDFSIEIAQFETVFWEPRDTLSLRGMIRQTPLVHGKTVLEIGAGTGLVSLCCLQQGAVRVVATDVNPAALQNTIYNAELLGCADRLETRQVSLDNSGAFAVVNDSERFDVIISNPPWVDHNPDTIDLYAFYDSDFALMRSIVEGLDRHLAPGGRVLLAYGCVTAIKKLTTLARTHGYSVHALDDRSLDRLPDVFLPGMLLELKHVNAVHATTGDNSSASP